LLGGEIAEGAGELAGVIEAGCARGAEIHRAAGIHEEAETEVRVGFELLDIEAVAAAPGAPVEAAGIVARDIFPVLSEFQAEPRTGLRCLPETLPSMA